MMRIPSDVIRRLLISTTRYRGEISSQSREGTSSVRTLQAGSSRNQTHLSRRQTMANDSSLIDIEALALESVHGGRFILPGGGGYAPPPGKPAAPKPPAGGSLTAPGVHLSCPP